MSKKKSFELLDSKIQKAIFNLKWKNFKKIQDEAINSIIKTSQDVVISAPTSSGKTEAAFLPLLSNSAMDIKNNIKIIYISPLKALINDQFLRVENLCKELNCKVVKWHGDASISKKKKMMKTPNGVLLITPESLESLLINKSPMIHNLFCNIDCYVIDESHSFIGGVRGEQLKSILNRIDFIINNRPRRVLLSATIGSKEIYKEWLGRDFKFIESNEAKGMKGSIRFFEGNSSNFYKELSQLTNNGKYLIFGNSKGYLEEVCTNLKSYDKFLSKNIDIHHGSLSKDQREYVEDRLKNKKEHDLAVFCTNTLELGIDIGDIKEVALIDPPVSMASLIQKIGRSGRSDNSNIEFRFILENLKVENNSAKDSHLRINLIKSIALVELLRGQKPWCEPGQAQTNGYSTLAHQIMAYIAQRREVRFQDIKKHISEKSFSSIASKEDFEKIINHLILKKYLRQTKENTIILDIEGDKLTESYKFYPVFFTPKEWSLEHKSSKIGTISFGYNFFKPGDNIIFSGKAWTIENVFIEDKVIKISPSRKGITPRFPPALFFTHKKIHKEMKFIYEEDKKYHYLKDDTYLNKAKISYKKFFNSDHFLFLFSGSKVSNIVSIILNHHGYQYKNLDIGFFLDKPCKENVLETLKLYDTEIKIKNILDKCPTEQLQIEKFDHMLPSDILKKSYLNRAFSIKDYLNFFIKKS